MTSSTAFRRVQKVCTLWTHDHSFSTEDVVFNCDRFQELGLEPGGLAQIIAIRQGTAVRDFNNADRDVFAGNNAQSPSRAKSTRQSGLAGRRHRSGSLTTTFDENGAQISGRGDVEAHRSYVFVVKDAVSDLKSRHPGLQISISQAMAQALGFRRRMQVMIATTDIASHAASHVEIAFKDEYLSRADMWRLAIAELSQKTVYKDQKLFFLGTIKATVKSVWIDGQKKRSAFFAASTKPVFRSESARFILFIQMSKETWDFDSEGSGEIMFNKVINGFLPELFKNWMLTGARHLVSIVLFSRLEYDESDHKQALDPRAGKLGTQASTTAPKDFYRVVVSDVASNDWVKILWQLKKEFRTFLRDVSIQRQASESNNDSSLKGGEDPTDSAKYVIVGRPTISSKGNILEAILLASSQFSRDYIDRDLVRTGISVVVVTAGTGVYEVDYNTLKLTTDTLIGSGIGIDLVCLSSMPLHSVPLFKYRNPRLLDDSSPVPTSPISSLDPDDSTPRQFHVGSLSSRSFSNSQTRYARPLPEFSVGEWSYAMPHWVDISFWRGALDEQAIQTRQKKPRSSTGPRERRSEFALRCRMYELQMMGVMENEMTNIAISHLHDNAMHPWHKIRPQMKGRPISDNDRARITKLERDWMEDYDDTIFKPLHQRRAADEKAQEDARAVVAQQSSSDGENVRAKAQQYLQDIAGQSYRPGTGYLDWKMRDRAPASSPAVHRKSSITSLATNPDNMSISSKASKPSRQISFGTAGLGTPKAVVSMNVSTSALNVRPAIFSKVVDASPAQGLSKYAHQLRATLTRTISQPNTPQRETKAVGAEQSSRPIDIGAAKPLVDHRRSESGDVDVDSEAIVREGQRDAYMSPELRLSPTKTQKPGAILFAASNARKPPPRPSVTSTDEMLQRSTPASSLSPWLVLINPCNPKRNDLSVKSQFRRWQHVFPRQLRTASMKWKSLCSPASVPLTNDYFPSAEQLASEFQESPYRLSQYTEDELSGPPAAREALIREMIAFRLAHGFQLVVGAAVSEFLGSHMSDLVNIFDKEYMAKEGATVFMTAGNVIHQLLCTASGEIEVRRFRRKSSVATETMAGSTGPLYKSYIRTFLEGSYDLREIAFNPPRGELNWNYIDSFLAGYHDEFSETLHFWRARFVLIPVDIPQQGRRQLLMPTEDSAEEVRLEGIRKLTQIWQGHRVISFEDTTYQSTHQRKDPNPLAIEYQTRDPSAILAAGTENMTLADTESTVPSTGLFSEQETYSTKNVDLKKLAHDLQGERGIRIIDRRWHFRLHYHCFVGFDLTSWLLQKFRDIESRDDAVAFGNELMDQGLFQHTTTRHRFRDGQYFYQLASEYRVPRPESRTSWFGTRRGDRSVPPTPLTETPKTGQARPDTSSSSEKEGEKTPVMKPIDGARRKVFLSHVMRYDLDPRKRSYRPELINLHYDRLHNPDNCYHIRIDWMNATAKFIEDAISHWALTVERYGLKLVELPIAEASKISETHPFRSPYLVKLVVPPPQSLSFQYFDEISFAPQAAQDTLAYHKLLLRKMQFVLDVESASSFPSEVDVSYSWGKPEYKYSQYIHKTGIVVAQITNEGDFLLLANRLYNNRSFSARDPAKFDVSIESHHDRPRPNSMHGGQNDHGHGSAGPHKRRGSPLSSPSSKATAETYGSIVAAAGNSAAKLLTMDNIKDQFETFCHDADALIAFYDEARRPQPNPSPSPHLTPTLDSTVPNLKLPPSISSIRHTSLSPAMNGPASAI